MKDLFNISSQVKQALNYGKPIVALESSYFTNGLPKDVSLEAVEKVEEAVKETGAYPATTAIIDGQIKVGLSKDEIKYLCDSEPYKVGVRDIPIAILKKWNAGTTVSASARIASAVGIPVLATGGIGGVHVGFDKSLDISSDLWELARNSITVVCSGVKNILDIAATCEWLETHCIPIYGLATSEMPAFYTRKSGIKIPQLDSLSEVVDILNLSPKVGLKSSALLVVPVPENHDLDVSVAFLKALNIAENQGITGKELTPFLLNLIAEYTDGKSIETNISLLINNAKTAAELAVVLARDCERKMGFVV